MEIKISDLRNITNLLFNHLESIGINKIEITKDFYWFIQKEELYNPYDKPQKIDLGQLSDDWDDLGKILKGQDDPGYWDFVDLSALLRFIGESDILLKKVIN